MGRPRIIPKQSKSIKYFYIICVNFKGKPTLKFGISNNVWRRLCQEYKNSETSGYLIDVLNVYKCSNSKRLETILKFYMPQVCKSIYKQEYFEMEYYDFIREKALELAKQFNYKINEINFEEERQKLIKK